MTDTGREFRITGWHVLWGMVAFFGMIIVVNFFFIRVALQTHSGTIGPNPYKAGLKYNEQVAAEQRQIASGWQDTIGVAADGKSVVVTLTDAAGHGISGLKPVMQFARPATDREDAKLQLADQGNGRYGAALPDGAYGNYIASVEVADPAKGAEIVYRARKRLVIGR